MKRPILLLPFFPVRWLLPVAGLAFGVRSGEAQSWTKVTTLAPSAGTGACLDLEGDILVTGSPDHWGASAPGSGAVFVWERDLGGKANWGKRTKLLASAIGGQFGSSVSMFGDTLVVGAPLYTAGTGLGAAWVFERDLGGPDEWGESAVLFASDGSGGERFGSPAEIWEDTIAAGAYLDDSMGVDSGAAYVYQRDQGGLGAWGEVAKLTASDGSSGDAFGDGIAIWKDTIVVGASWQAGARGAVYVFERNHGGPNAWGEVAKLTASDGGSGNFFGNVVLWEDTLVVGASGADPLGQDSGAAYVFERVPASTAWIEVMKLVPSSGAAGERFGRMLSISGQTLGVATVVAGKAYRFERNLLGPEAWLEHQVTLNGSLGFGAVIAVGPREAAITDSISGPDPVHVFEDRTGTNYCTAGTSASGCQARISALGTPSATAATGFFLDVAVVEGDSKGLFFFGTSGRQANPWGNGTSFQCVVPPAKRAGLLPQVGAAGTCGGAFTQDLNAHWCPTCPKPHHNPGAGTVTQAQLWYRDRNSTSNQTTGLSDAIEFVVAP